MIKQDNYAETYSYQHKSPKDSFYTTDFLEHVENSIGENKYNKNTSKHELSSGVKVSKPKESKTEKKEPMIKQKPQLNKIRNTSDILFALKGFVHTRGSIPKAKINAINKRFKKEFHQLSRKNIIQIFYYYALLQVDKDHALPILKRAKAYFDQSKDLFKDIDESEFRKLIIAKRYFDVLGFPIDITHHSNFESYLTNLRKWVIKTRVPSKAQKHAIKIVRPFLSDIESESYIDIVGDCVDIYAPSSNLVIEVDGEKYHTLRTESVTPKANLITQLKTFLLKKHGFHLIRLDAEKVIHEGRPYILNKIAPFLRTELEFLQNDYIQDLYENGGKYSYDIVETNEEHKPDCLNSLVNVSQNYNNDNPEQRRTLSLWMTSLLQHMQSPSCHVQQFMNCLADLNKIIHVNETMKAATFAYFQQNPTFLQEVMAKGNELFDQFNLYDFQSFLKYGSKVPLPFTEDIFNTWCIYVEPMFQHAKTEDIENTVKSIHFLKLKPTPKFIDAIFHTIKARLPELHVQKIITLLSQISSLNIAISPHWNEYLVKHITPRLKCLEISSLFVLIRNNSMDRLLNHEIFAQEWFSLTAEKMPYVQINALINVTLYNLYKFENAIPDFWLNALSLKLISEMNSLKIHEVTHLVQGLAYTFVNPRRIESLLIACQNAIMKYDAPTYDKLSQDDLAKILPAINYFKLGGVDFYINTSKYQQKIQALLKPDDNSKNINALLTEYVKEHFTDIEENKPVEEILKPVDFYSNAYNLIIFTFNDDQKLRSRLNAEILKSNKYNLLLLNDCTFKHQGREYIDFEIKKYINTL